MRDIPISHMWEIKTRMRNGTFEYVNYIPTLKGPDLKVPNDIASSVRLLSRPLLRLHSRHRRMCAVRSVFFSSSLSTQLQ